MKNRFTVSLIALALSLFSSVNTSGAEPKINKAVTYDSPKKGRLGNHLVSYAHAKWVSYKYGIPVLFVPFEFSDQFAFHQKETLLRSKMQNKFKKHTVVLSQKNLDKIEDSTMLIVPFFRNEPGNERKDSRFKIDWKDPEFHNLIKTLFQPSHPIRTVEVAKDRFNLIIHVRTGGGFDSAKRQLDFPKKFPPHSFYISAVKTVSEHLNHAKIYAYIMTDDQNPKAIAESYKDALSEYDNIKFGFSGADVNGPANNVMEDFYSIPKFDGCIRGDSTFALMASYLGDMQITVCPKKARVIVDKIVVEEVDIRIKE